MNKRKQDSSFRATIGEPWIPGMIIFALGGLWPYIMGFVWFVLRPMVAIMVTSSANAAVYPQDANIDMGYAVNHDTVTFSLYSVVSQNEFWLSEHSDSVVTLIECLVDGSPFVPTEEFDNIYPGLTTKRFLISGQFNGIVLRYVCGHLTNKMNWVLTTPAFAVLGDINGPQRIAWNKNKEE